MPFNRALMVLNSGYLGYNRGQLGDLGSYKVLGGSLVVISGVRSPLIWVISIVSLLILVTTHEPPSRVKGLGL